MSTTTPDEGAAAAAQPPAEAVAQPGDMVISKDASGTPVMVPAITEPEQPSEPSEEEATEEIPEAQAESEPNDTEAWAKKKGLPLDDPVKLAQMYRDSERKMHEATQAAKQTVLPPELLPETADPNVNAVVERQNVAEQRMYVRDWFDANPDMRDHRAELAKVAGDYPYIPDMNVIKSIYLADPSREDTLRSEGGKRALQNLAQKQSNIPPASAATNTGDYSSTKITPKNLDQIVSAMTPEEYKKRLPEINAALQG